MAEKTDLLDTQNAQEVLKKTQEALGKRNGNLNNAAVVNKIGNKFAGAGLKNIHQPDSPENKADADTMFAEASIGKVRYAGLAHMMAQEGIFGEKGLQQNAKDFFAQEKVSEFLEKKYPGKNLQSAIVNLFTDGSEEATLADLTTHRSGVGDTTGDALEMVKKRGSQYEFTLPDLILPQPESIASRDANNKPMAKKGLRGDLARAVYGDHEYSNLGYQILGAAMEAAYFIHKGVEKDYQQLMKDFMLHPIEGRAAKSGLSFDHTKFPKDLKEGDNVVQAKMVEKDQDGNDVAVNVNAMSAANAAGGMFASANDSEKFFSEYFKGFPGTADYGKDVNPFFTVEMIQEMWKEARKHPSFANQPAIDAARAQLAKWNERNPSGEESESDKKPIIPNPQFQFPGAVALTNDQGEIVKYVKNGGTIGYISSLEFDVKNGVSISMINQENVTSQREREQKSEEEKKSENSWVEKLDLEKNHEEKGKSFVQRMRSDPTKGKSSAGFNEI